MDTTAIRKPDIMRDSVIASSIYIEHLGSCKRCFHNLCKEAKELENTHNELSNKARNTEEQVLLKIVKEEIIPEGYYDVLTAAYNSLLASNALLGQEGYVGWDSATSNAQDILEHETGNYCRWELTSALLGRSFLIPADEMVKIFGDLEEYKRQSLSLRTVIEAENAYRDHISVCDVKNTGCELCLDLFKKHEVLRLAVLTTDGGKVIYDRYKSLEGYIQAINDDIQPKLAPSVDEYLSPFLEPAKPHKTVESMLADGDIENESDAAKIADMESASDAIDGFISKYQGLLEQNNALQAEVELIKSKILDGSLLNNDELKTEIDNLRNANKSLRERNDKLNNACKNYSEFVILSRDLLAEYFKLGASEGSIAYNKKLVDISSDLFIHLME